MKTQEFFKKRSVSLISYLPWAYEVLTWSFALSQFLGGGYCKSSGQVHKI